MKKVIKKNQVIITSLAILIAVAGYLNFTDLRTKAEDASKRELNLKQFHQQILEIGPAPFPVLEKYVMNAWE